ncbi:hypothetical protein Tco_0194361 [Tanacetum coccineum]
MEVNEIRAERLAKTHDPLGLMENSQNSYNYPVFHLDQPSQITYMQQPQPNNNFVPQSSFNMNYMHSSKTTQHQPTTTREFHQTLAPGRLHSQEIMLGTIQGIQNVRNQNGLIAVPRIANQNGNGNVVAARAEGNGSGNTGNQIWCFNCRGLEARIQLQAKEFDLMAAVGDIDEIEEVNANCILMANLQQALTSDNTPSSSFARKFLNEVKDTIVTLQRVVKSKMSLNVNNWSSNVHQEVYKNLKDELATIVNQVDARVQNFEKKFLKEAAKFVQDFKSLVKEADKSLDINKVLEHENERLLRAVASQDIMSIVQNNFVVDTSNLQTELDLECTAKTRRPQPRSNTKNDRVSSESKGSCIKNKEVENDKSEVVCAMCNNACASNHQEPTSKQFLNSTSFLGRSKDEATEEIKTFLKKIQVLLQASVIMTQKIMETMNVRFDELLAMDFEQHSSKPELQGMISGHISSGLDLTYAPSIITSQKPTELAEDVQNAMFNENTFVNPFASASTSSAESSSHTMEPSNVKEDMTVPGWTDSMQEELFQFKQLDVWELVPLSDNLL